VGVKIRVSEKWSQDLSNGTNVASSLPNFFSVFTSMVYGFNPGLIKFRRDKLHIDVFLLLFLIFRKEDGSGRSQHPAVALAPPPGPGQMSCKSLMQAVRSFLHFSQLAAWYSSSQGSSPKNVMYRVGIANDHLDMHQSVGGSGGGGNSAACPGGGHVPTHPLFGHHDFDSPDSVSEHTFPVALVGNKREVVQVGFLTIKKCVLLDICGFLKL
jgi:hypothetical protein